MPSYQEAGVDLDAAQRHVSAISDAVTSTWNEHVVGMFGGFAAGIEIPDGYHRPVLMMSTDGVGTKLEIARRANLWDGVGFDLVAMCVDDLAAVGARPLAFVDYMAVGSLVPERDTTIIESISMACRAAGCALLGGETAEHPGVMPKDAVDLAGAATGVVERASQLGAHLVESGDRMIGLRSPNLRSNGFSLVRAVLGDRVEEHAGELLEPSVIYAPSVLAAIGRGGIHAAAHITGGGIAGNVGRVIPAGLGVRVDTSAWIPPEVFSLISGHGVDRDDMFETFNMGIGFCLIVDPDHAGDVSEAVRLHDPVEIGEVVPGEGVTLT